MREILNVLGKQKMEIAVTIFLNILYIFYISVNFYKKWGLFCFPPTYNSKQILFSGSNKSLDFDKRQKTYTLFKFVLINSAYLYWQKFATMFLWVSITPFGNPVVPELYGSVRMSLSGSNFRWCGYAFPSSFTKSEKLTIPGPLPSTIVFWNPKVPKSGYWGNPYSW